MRTTGLRARGALAALVVVALGTAVLTDQGARLDRDTAHRAVAIATLPCDTDLQSTSSGYVVDDELVVTVAHAIFETRDFAVRDSTGVWHHAEVRQLDLARDLAVLRVDGLRAEPVRFGTGAAGETVRMVGGAASGMAAGSVSRRVNLRTNVVGGDDISLRAGYELALEIDPGDSGAAIVDSEDRVIAIVFARSTRRSGVSWATAIDELDTLLGLGQPPEWDCADGPEGVLELRPPAPERVAG